MNRATDESEKNINMKEIKLPSIRPPGPIKIWKTIDVFKTIDGESKPVKIVLQEIPEDRYEDILDYMVTYFVIDEPCCVSLNLKEDPVAVQELRNIWTIILNQGLSVGAFLVDPKGGKPEIVGTNIIGYEIKDDNRKLDNYKIQECLAKDLIDPVMKLCKDAKIYEHYNTDRYMFAFGLSVHPSYRGHKLGAQILSVREQIGREYNIGVTATIFSSTISQKSAARCGFEVLLAKDYDQILNEEGKEIFPGIKFKTFKVMGRRLY
ncbi:uncharacterized protein LOC124428301 [Vespa crabro]|uniref:uncharacterized protein LOC124428301 n=1 Tax=Vespa crabro TaxID=7445 RepID=UPI001EFF6CFE|nr:uncharacterized protein LOC124428301 [Vespa crabro]XP_046828192.1 uncharacterized protein LOC124428301 [Vespa crabro]